MRRRLPLDRIELLLIGLAVLLLPVLIVVITLGFLVFAGGLVVEELSLLELVELYVLEMLLVAGSLYLLYRLLVHLLETRLPEALDRVDREGVDGREVDASTGGRDDEGPG